MENLLMFFLTETDGDIAYMSGTLEELKSHCEKKRMDWDDVIIVDGKIEKKAK